jgi:SAM-dependent methyltransferase
MTATEYKILDPCCGSRMFWFDRENPNVLFGDIREESHILCDGRTLEINPDVIMDFTRMPFDDESFKLVVFDPPHIKKIGEKSWMAKKYGKLQENWQNMLSDGFSECFRVLKEDGVLIFKWNDNDFPVSKILGLTDQKPLFGHKSGKAMKTHWITFMKERHGK